MREYRGGGIGMIFQEPATSLNPVLTVGRQIVEALELHSRCAARRRARAPRNCSTRSAFPIQTAARRIPFQLSGGLRQRVMIAIALAGAPRLLIADEPTTALDVTIQAQVLDLLDDCGAAQGMALLLITHDLGVVARMADRIGVMYAGQLVEEAPREAFFARRRIPIRCACSPRCPMPSGAAGGWRPFPAACRRPTRGTRLPLRRALRRSHGGVPQGAAALARCRGGQRVRCVLADAAPAVPRESAPVIRRLRARRSPCWRSSDLKVHFPIRRGILQRAVGAVRAVDGMSLQLMPGRTLALVGESGCGKTTAGKAMLQLIRPTAGSVQLDGVELTTRSTARTAAAAREDADGIPGPLRLAQPALRIGDIIAEGMRRWARRMAMHRAASPAAGAGRPARRHGEPLSARVLRRPAPAHRHCPRPGGESATADLRRADLGAGCFGAGADPQPACPTCSANCKLAYLFITHNIAVVDYLAHDVAVMYLGRVVESGSAEEVLRSPRHPYTKALLAAVPRVDGARRVRRSSPATCPRRRIRRRAAISIRAARWPTRAAARLPGETLFGATHVVRCIKALPFFA
jgi:peptide/nickel transport system ATP-binding protein